MPFLGALRVRAACPGFGPAAGLARARKGPLSGARKSSVHMKKCTKGRRTRDGGFFPEKWPFRPSPSKVAFRACFA